MNIELEIANRMAELMRKDKLSCRHWLVFFKDTTNNEVSAYDARVPMECVSSVTRLHPTYKFLALRGCDSSASAVEFAKAIRTAGSLIAWAEEDYKQRSALNNQPTNFIPEPTAALRA